MIEILNNRCPTCGRFMKIIEKTETRTVWHCTNTATDHEWDEG